jgi:hypothetical protein
VFPIQAPVVRAGGHLWVLGTMLHSFIKLKIFIKMEKKNFKAPEGANLNQRYLNSGRGFGKHTLKISENSVIEWKEYEIQSENVHIPSIQGFSVPKLIGAGCESLMLEGDTASIVREGTYTVTIKEGKETTLENGQTYTPKVYVVEEKA